MFSLCLGVYALHTFNVEGTHIQELGLVNLDGLRVALAPPLLQHCSYTVAKLLHIHSCTLAKPELANTHLCGETVLP